MEPEGIHELTAAYALAALDADQEREYEEHLRHCPSCREDLVAFQDAAASLAYATEGPAPAPGLRQRILDAAAAERPNVVPLRRQWALPTLGAVAAVAACAAIGLGVWAATLRSSLDEREAAAGLRGEVLAIFADSRALQVPVEGTATGTLVVGGDGEAALVFTGLAAAAEGKTYQVWVIEGTSAPRPAGLFEGGEDASIVRVTEPVPLGATVAVTVEPDGGVQAPTTEPFVIAPTV